MQDFPNVPPGMPVYQLLSPWFGDDDTLHPEGEQIAYPGTPNEFMAPLNEPARKKMQEYLAYLDECGREKARIMGRTYQGRDTDIGDQIMRDRTDAAALARRAELVMPAVAAPAPLRPDMVPMAQRRAATRKKSQIAATRAAPEVSGRPEPMPIANAPLGGQ